MAGVGGLLQWRCSAFAGRQVALARALPSPCSLLPPPPPLSVSVKKGPKPSNVAHKEYKALSTNWQKVRQAGWWGGGGCCRSH